MQILLNGAPHTVDEALSLSALVEALDLTGKRIAVERNGEVVPRASHTTTRLADGDRIEIIVAVGGG